MTDNNQNINKINDAALEEVTGGARKVVYGDRTSKVNVRSGPGTNYRVCGAQYDGDVVYTVDKVYSEYDGFYWSQLDDGCWIASHFLHD